jgi:hypothetical protein
MKKGIAFIFSFLSATILVAQWNPTANLTIFSDDGSAFYLILNGEKYNNEPQTNVRIEELPNPYYSSKIIFEDKTKPAISKNIQLTDVDGVPQDVTYIIKPQTPTKYVLRYYSMVPAEQNMMRPSSASVYRYGNPNIVVAGPGYNQQSTVVQSQTVIPSTQTTTHQVTTTTTTQTVPQQNGVNVNVGGLGINMNVNLPIDVAGSSTTTSTTTTQTSGYQHNHNNTTHYDDTRCVYAMSSGDYSTAKATIEDISFSDTQLATAKNIAESNCLTTDQIAGIMDIFSFEDPKIEFAKYAYDYCVDQNNYYKLASQFSFDASKEELNNYLQGR